MTENIKSKVKLSDLISDILIEKSNIEKKHKTAHAKNILENESLVIESDNAEDQNNSVDELLATINTLNLEKNQLLIESEKFRKMKIFTVILSTTLFVISLTSFLMLKDNHNLKQENSFLQVENETSTSSLATLEKEVSFLSNENKILKTQISHYLTVVNEQNNVIYRLQSQISDNNEDDLEIQLKKLKQEAELKKLYADLHISLLKKEIEQEKLKKELIKIKR